MRLKGQYIIFLLLIVLLCSCGKEIAPSGSSGKQPKGFDTATFNYLYVEALKQKLMGNGGEALKYFEQSVRLNPESDAAYFQMAQIVLANNDIANGKKYALKATSISIDNIWYLMMLASLYYQEKNLDSAIYYYETAVRYFPERENLQMMLGNLYTENREYDKANSVYEGLDKKYGVNETTAVSSIKSLMAAGKYDEALIKSQQLVENKPEDVTYATLLAEVYRAKGDNASALDVYKALIDRDSDDPQTQLALSDFLLKEKFYDELFLLLNNIILNVNITREEKFDLFGRLIQSPDLVNKQGDNLSIAIRVLEANYKGDSNISMLRPELLIRQQKLNEAAILLEGITKKEPEFYYAWEKMLFVYLQLGDFKQLMIKGEQASALFNRSFVAKVLYANGALEMGQYQIALDELKKAEILAGNDKAFLNQVFTMKADAYYRMKDYNKAFELFDEVLKNDSEDLIVLNNYAYYLAEQDMNLKEAEEMSKKVVEKEKENTTYLDTYAWVLYKRGKLNEAARVMESIIESGEKPDAVWYEHYGYILKKQNKCEKAIENWNKALIIDPGKADLVKEIENCKK
jgi:predicted Zn-dependent protease